MTKPVLLLDMDGPLADFDGHFWRWFRNAFTFDIDGPAQQTHRYMTEHIVDRQQRKMARSIVDSSNWFRNLPVTVGAIEGVPVLEEHFNVWVCTKPLDVNPTCLNDKQAWLAEHFPTLRRKLVTVSDKSMVRGAVLLDDAPKLEWIPKAEWNPVVFKAPFNAHGPLADFPQWAWGEPLEPLFEAAEARLAGAH